MARRISPSPLAGEGWGGGSEKESRLLRLEHWRAGERARELRRALTEAERKLWHKLRGGRVLGFSFRKQAPLGPYIADFVCFAAKLVIEVDGDQHAERIEHDEARTRYLESRGFTVLRFWNSAVLTNLDGVMDMIHAELSRQRDSDLEAPHPNPPPQRERG